MSFGKTLQKIRREKGKKQRDVAKDIGMDFSYFSRLENDRFDSKPTRETIEKIADALECTPEEQSELLASAGRIDEELEQMALRAGENPKLRELFKSASMLPNEQIEKHLRKIKSDLGEESSSDPEEN
jgi:transcriptional regulator with XRE-family HTH domain